MITIQIKALARIGSKSEKVITSVVDIPKRIAQLTNTDEQYKAITAYVNEEYDIEIIDLIDAEAI